jgi:NAD(P)-dependent dehydrogenase (short-subunit alcohol dehydrogenase family)
MRLQGKTALVTGASDPRSIGWGIARALAEEGADVVVNDVVRPDALAERVRDLEALGRRGLAVQADVTVPEQVGEMFARAEQAFGRIDIVVSNAGIIRWEHFLAITAANLRAIVAVNIKGNVNVCRAAAKHMRAHGGGRIIITSSVQSDMQFPITPVYGATKRAMHIFVGCLALELAEYGITVNHIGPGWVMSALNDPSPELQTEAGLKAQRQAVPLKRDGRIDEMGRAVVFLASSDADYITGEYIRIDGGLGIGKYSR